MPFFLPGRLVEFEYLKAEPDAEYAKIAEPYRNDLDFAFFAVQFGYSKADYEALTPREKAFIYKAWEDKLVADTTFIYNAVFTATYNCNRPKRKRALKLFKKSRTRKADMELIKENLKTINEVERKEGNAWINRIYQVNGFELGRRSKDG